MTNFVERPIGDVARELGLAEHEIELYGRGKAKVELGALKGTQKGKGRLILVSAINPTPAGEGKTTTSIGLAMGMRRLGKNVVLALREPSLGPVFGVKGGGTGGGKASLVPTDDINLHFTGDMHAITAAHNLLAALVDNACYFRDANGGVGELDPRLVTWGRALDMNDRFLRDVIVGLGGKSHGTPRQSRFDITAASEIMAILALATDYADLEARLGRIVVGTSWEGKPVTAKDLGAAGAMTALLRDALKPNLVQTREGGPAVVHCGPFGNIAHGCNSILATRLAMHLGDYVVTEAGFGFDLGGEKFLDIKCRTAGVWPRAVVVVATMRALKMHGGASVKACGEPNRDALEKGLVHLDKHLETAQLFGLTPIVAINVFPQDSEDELALVQAAAQKRGARVARSEGFMKGGEGTLEFAKLVAEVVDGTDAAPPKPKYLYELTDAPDEKMRKIARGVYGARNVVLTAAAKKQVEKFVALGYGELPICMAKTQLSLSDDAALFGRPRDFDITIREVRLSAGAAFLVALAGEMMTMPGLPKVPAARNVKLHPDGRITGLMQND